MTSGTVDIFGPFETLSVIVEPCWCAAAGGLWSTTMPFGSVESTSRRATAKPGALQRRARLLERLADDRGHVDLGSGRARR